MNYEFFYDIAAYGNKAWKGNFSAKEIATNAYEYKCEWDYSVRTHKVSEIIKQLLRNLEEDKEYCELFNQDATEVCRYIETINDEIKKWRLQMKWVNTELPKEMAGRFKEYLRDMHIKYESSECGDLIHFECYMSQDEITGANAFIDSLDI